MKSSLGSWVVAALLLGAASVSAQVSDDERAHEHFRAARSYFEQSRYEDAEREFLESHRLSHRAELLVNIATCRERALDFAGAIEILERYLRERPNADDRTTIETRIQRMRVLAARADGSLSQAATTSAPLAPAAGSDLQLAGIVTLVGAGAALAGMLVTGLWAHALYGDLQGLCGPDRICPSSARSTLDAGQALAVTSTVLMVTAGVAGAVGALFLILGLTSSGPSAGLHLGPGLHLTSGPGAIGLALIGELR
jgi:tetratricopeptide (TPR) repeat protein